MAVIESEFEVDGTVKAVIAGGDVSEDGAGLGVEVGPGAMVLSGDGFAVGVVWLEKSVTETSLWQATNSPKTIKTIAVG